jgi:hypothetical protein
MARLTEKQRFKGITRVAQMEVNKNFKGPEFLPDLIERSVQCLTCVKAGMVCESGTLNSVSPEPAALTNSPPQRHRLAYVSDANTSIGRWLSAIRYVHLTYSLLEGQVLRVDRHLVP